MDETITEADAFAAFAAIQLWANDSDRSPLEFSAEQRAGMALSLIPVEI